MRILGQDDFSIEQHGAGDPGSFTSKPWWAQAIVLAAGVGMNFVLAIVVLTGAFAIGTEAPAGVVRVEEVAAGSPAEAAGMRAGDRLVKYDGAAIADENLLRLQLLAANGKKEFVVEREGEKEPREITITPRGSPIRVGISWREDPAEPGSVTLTQVIPGSAAALAGLANGDRLHTFAGKRFTGTDELSQLIATTPSPTEVILERRGRLRIVKLETLPAEAQP